MSRDGWKRLLAGWPWFRGEGAYPIPAYSEFMPPPRLARSPYGAAVASPLSEDDPWGWRVSEHEEADELRPGLEQVARQVVPALAKLCRGESSHGIARSKLQGNVYWPEELADRAGSLGHERFVVLMPLALSRTQNDQGRLRWTLFGGSEQGPARAFWRGFFTAPGREAPAERGIGFLRSLLAGAYGEPAEGRKDLRALGFRILPRGDLADPSPPRPEGPLPGWTAPLLWSEGEPVRGVRYLLTFRPFGALPDPVRRAYLSGRLNLLPCPASLLFWGASLGLELRGELPLAMQVPLLNRVERHDGPRGLRVPQSGWLHEPRPGSPGPGEHVGHVRNTYRRTHRMVRAHRDQADASEADALEDRMAHVLFDDSEAIGLYGKPMARNAQIWTEDYRVLLDGPRANRAQIEAAAGALKRGGLFGYRFQFPAMRVGRNEVYWHRPLAAFLAGTTGRVTVVDDGPLGYLTAYDADRPGPDEAVELWPRLLDREPYKAAGSLFGRVRDPRDEETAENCRKLLDARELLGGRPLPRSFARRLLKAPRRQTLDGWLDGLPGRADEPERAQRLAEVLRAGLETGSGPPAPGESLTFARTARRTFEVAYWRTIARLTDGRFANRNNADCVLDAATAAARKGHHRRDLEALGDHLLARHARAIEEAGMGGKATAGDLPFHWRTDFEFRWSGGWRASQGAEPGERDLIVIIPGRDRGRAVIMADHYDTAYMEDLYKSRRGGQTQGPRLATPGADDNTSATATLLQAAPVFLELSREGRLRSDIWLIHLTGEEFPADCLGARHLSQGLVQGTLAARLTTASGSLARIASACASVHPAGRYPVSGSCALV